MAEDKYKTPPDMQEIYDKNKEPEFDKAVEDAVNTTERGTVERKDALSDAAKKKRLYESIAFEIGANTAVDFATGWLAPAPPVYAGVNFVAGGAINTLAQLWRRDNDFSFGELGASSAISVIPGLGGKASIGKAALKGGLSGVTHEAIRIGIDEKRLPTAEEAVVGGTIGTVVGGGVTGAVKGIQTTVKTVKHQQAVQKAKELGLTTHNRKQLGLALLGKIDGQGELFDPNLHWTVRNYVEGSNRRKYTPKIVRPENPSMIQLNEFFPWELGPKGFIPKKSQRYWGTLPVSKQRTVKMDAGNLDTFKKDIWTQMELDDIRVQNVTLRGLGRKSKLENFGGVGFGELYYDYLGAHFDRWGNFQRAARVELPDGTIVKPSVYNTRGQKLEKINPEQKGKFYTGVERSKKDIKIALELPDNTVLESHHLDMIAASYPLYHGLDKKQRSIVKKMIEDAGIFTGDNPSNRWDLDPVVHDRVHIFLQKELKSRGIDKLDKVIVGSKFRTATSRKQYIQKYIEAINAAKEEVKFIVTDELQRTKAADLSKLSEKELDEFVTKLEAAKDIYDK